MRHLLLPGLLALAFLSAPARAAADAPRLLVTDLASHDVERRVVALLTEEIVSAMRDAARWEVISSAEIRELLSIEAERQLMGCEDTACFAELAGALGAREAITGVVGVLGDGLLVRLRLVDTGEGRVVGATSVASGSVDELRDLVRRAAFELAGVPYRAPAVREVIWLERDVAVTGALGVMEAGEGLAVGFGAAYQQRIGPVAVGPTLGYTRARTTLRWADLIRPYSEPVRVETLRVGALFRWPATGGRVLRGYLVTEIGLVRHAATSTARNPPAWIEPTEEEAFGVYVLPGAGLRLFPRSSFGFAIEIGWLLSPTEVSLHHRGVPVDGGGPPEDEAAAGGASAFLVTGVLRHGF